ncbi:MAG: MBL fold metallo-hydrolase [Clostridia bacterium]|nr:MBL fold metallo-hydrolase [Clostridia bacterium]
MKITFLGAAHEVTGSCTLLEANGKNILIDCGLEQGADIYENCEIPVVPCDIDAVCLTHAHIDHSGKIPALVANGFKGNIYTTLATHKLCNIMLRDSAHIQEFEAEWRNRKAKRAGREEYQPLYTLQDAENALKMFYHYDYNEPIEIFEGIRITFIDAGHLLGSASILFEITEGEKQERIIFSGDLGNTNRPLINDPSIPPVADYVIIESTYGDRTHGARPDYTAQLTEILQETFDRGGNVVIPSFAIGRTQEMLYLIRNIKEQGLIKNHANFSVYVDSPLAVEATNIYSSGLIDYYDTETLELLEQGIDPIRFNGLKLSVTSDDSKMINFDESPKVILSASGMCEAGRIRHHLKHNLWRKDSTILFVGYQSDGTVGRKLVDGEKIVKLFGEEINVNARIATLTGISGHADKDMMINWLDNIKSSVKTVFVNHGDDSVCDTFASEIEARLGIKTIAPFSGDKYDLITGECIEKGKIIRVEKKSEGRHRADTVFSRLYAAGQRLLSVINKNKESSNKEIARFADQITALCDKYDK